MPTCRRRPSGQPVIVVQEVLTARRIGTSVDLAPRRLAHGMKHPALLIRIGPVSDGNDAGDGLTVTRQQHFLASIRLADEFRQLPFRVADCDFHRYPQLGPTFGPRFEAVGLWVKRFSQLCRLALGLHPARPVERTGRPGRRCRRSGARRAPRARPAQTGQGS